MFAEKSSKILKKYHCQKGLPTLTVKTSISRMEGKCLKKNGTYLTTTLKQGLAQTVMKQVATHLLMSILKLSHCEELIHCIWKVNL